MKIGYGKLGRVIEQDPAKWGESGGDNEPITLLETLARRNPEHEFIVVGRNSGWKPRLPNVVNMWNEWGPIVKEMRAIGRQGGDLTSAEEVMILDEVTGPTFDTLDGIVIWLGQHGTSNSPIPKVEDRSQLTSPQISFVHYSSFLMRGINRWRDVDPVNREEVWLLPDARNYIKGRDLKWPRRHPILYQMNWARDEWNERYGDDVVPDEFIKNADAGGGDGMWRSFDKYVGSNLELVGVPSDVPVWPSYNRRENFAVIINEARNYGMRPELTRLDAMQKYILPNNPTWVHGKWTDKSLAELGMNIVPIEYTKIWDIFLSSRATFTTPSSGSGIATAKPWEAFRCGCVCFFHPEYDTQGWIIPTLAQARGDRSDRAQLARWLRIETPRQLSERLKAIAEDPSVWTWLADVQLQLFNEAQAEAKCVTMIEQRAGLR